MKNLVYNVILKPEPEGGYTVTVPALPGCITYGKNLEEAKKMAKEAISVYIASLKKHRESVPTDEVSFITSVTIPKKSKIKTHA
ncbi:type II toxin-antitoxin system HicB family antitoxin [Patescibacteria group bacterium]|nr:type II toxin-antitoxin system HicB family antitoxin [Patescibacteria group bacterium]MBU1673388.1 type II toxin-antitoxin system HicB family antitoxin [Patescibacteria group bacterium]MBU1963286.1 type II toxin-antitoxin system HicB family antitoxin [Patescibacteria group bacterium]